jgi:hypothetical protein
MPRAAFRPSLPAISIRFQRRKTKKKREQETFRALSLARLRAGGSAVVAEAVCEHFR